MLGVLTNEKPEIWGVLTNERAHLARLDCAEVDDAPGQELDGLGPGPVVLGRVQLKHSDSHHMSLETGLKLVPNWFQTGLKCSSEITLADKLHTG